RYTPPPGPSAVLPATVLLPSRSVSPLIARPPPVFEARFAATVLRTIMTGPAWESIPPPTTARLARTREWLSDNGAVEKIPPPESARFPNTTVRTRLRRARARTPPPAPAVAVRATRAEPWLAFPPVTLTRANLV